MKPRQEARKAYSIKQENGRFKVFDKDSKYRQSFLTIEQATAFGEGLAAHHHRQAEYSIPLEA
jgi:hypothetical protein